jgi:hypothetical protein
MFFCRNGTCKKRRHSMLIGGGCQLENVVRQPVITLKSVRPTARGSQENVELQRPLMTCVIDKGHSSVESLSPILY